MPAQAERTTFLLVEDDANDVLLIQREFLASGVGACLRHVSDGVEAIRYLVGENEFADRRRYPLPDILLLDLKLPRFSGFDFLQWLHRDAPGELRILPVLVLSSSDDPADVRRAYSLGANAYLVKPHDWNGFRERLRAIRMFWEQIETPVVIEAKKVG